ncbi:serine--tRNA ligase [Candidatus Babeliales bacterium]|nr:serine--tRNA ligase [Candidatus Babeliales bacterium]
MIDRHLLREQPEETIKKLKLKDPSFNAERLVELDVVVRELQQRIEALRKQRNDLADKGKSGVTQALRDQSAEVGKKLKQAEQEFQQVSAEFSDLYLSCPNIPETTLPVGGPDKNQVVREWGKQPSFSFTPKHHLDLAVAAQWIDFETAAVTTGSQFPLYKGDAVKLVYALTMFMLKHNMRHGYSPVLPPALVNEESLFVASNFPKFKDQVYAVKDEDLYLIPTAEVSLLNMYRKNIFHSEQLPERLCAWTSCFRREAGGYGATERGLIRVHQFEKVELFAFTKPEDSSQELERMLTCAEEILQALGLHYRVSLLATQDCSFPSAKTFDIEVWMPGQNAYFEVSSCSNCTDFQARRGSIRYREKEGAKPQLVHTLNGSSLALSRLMVALIETYQQKDGTIVIPDVLKREGLF